MKLGNAVDVFVGEKAVKLLDANAKRKTVNLWAGPDSHLWFGGNRNVQAGTIGNQVSAGTAPVEIKASGEVWVIREKNTSGLCGYSEEFTFNG